MSNKIAYVAHALVCIDQAVSTAVVAGYRLIVAKLGQNCVGELLAQLNPHLIKAINIPDSALREDFVFV